MRALALLLLSVSLPASAGELLLNSSDAAAFDAVEGVDLALANRIVDLRSARGGTLSSVEALRSLDIPADTLDRLRSEVAVDLPITKVQGQKRSFASADEVLAEFQNEPDIRAVQAMSMSYTKTSPELVEAWLGASKMAYALPKVQLGYAKDLDLNQDFEYALDADGALESTLTDADTDNNDSYTVKLEWRLDKLVMSSERIRVINEAQDIVKLRDKVLDEVTRVYFDRRRLQVEMLLSPPGDVRAQIKDQLRLQELTANLDAYTGGGFSAAIKR
jgi:hypothetical protein